MRFLKSTLLGLGALSAATGLSAGAASAQAIACGGEYTVEAGDTLREIAVRAYGDGAYQLIYNANSQRIGPNPNIIEIGERLNIPCRTDVSASAGQTVTPQPRVADLGGEAEFPRIKFLTGGDYQPFTDEELPEGGLFTELVKKSMGHADAERPYRVTFVNDWGPHLSILLPEGAFDLGFPWFKPDCTKINKLSEGMRARCQGFDFSAPFYELVIGFFTPAGSQYAEAASYEDLFGARVCRPRGYFTFDLEQEDLVEPNITMVVPQTPAECFEQLVSGEVDIATINVLIAEDELAKLGASNTVVELGDLASVQTLHVLSPKSNPYGRTYLTLINKGLRTMRESGEWFEVVSRHLALHAQNQQN